MTIQDQIIDALKEIGFTERYKGRKNELEYKNYPIKIKEDETLASVFSKLIKMGENLKVWEIKRVMHIVDPMI